MLCLSPITTRNDFGTLLNQMGLLDTAVEVGTHRGAFALQLLIKWNGKLLNCIDPWENLPEYIEQSGTLYGGETREDDLKHCKKILKPYDDRKLLHRGTSAKTSEKFIDNELDFVYLDGNHEPPYVLQDIQLWWPKVKPGGILAGHDFLCHGEVNGGWGQHIQPAVLSFFSNHSIYMVMENGPWSYYVIK